MLTTERKRLLLEQLRKKGKIEAKKAAEELGISDDTIRRDLRELAAAGKLQRVHGGALPKAAADADIDVRQSISIQSKREVGATAAKLIKPDQVLIIDGGTTALQLICNLSIEQRNTVITHSPTVAVALAPFRDIKVIMIGGVLFRHSMVNVGASAVEAVSHFHADTYFMGVTGVDMSAGLSTGDYEEAHIKKALSDRAAETIVLASREKLEVASPYVIMPVVNASAIVLDSRAPKKFSKAIQKLGLEVHVSTKS